MFQWWLLYLLTKTIVELNSNFTNDFFMNKNVIHKIFTSEGHTIYTNVQSNKTNHSFLYNQPRELYPKTGFWNKTNQW